MQVVIRVDFSLNRFITYTTSISAAVKMSVDLSGYLSSDDIYLSFDDR